MKILDWYIIKQFLVTFLFAILTITTIAIVIDTSEKADDFVKSGLPFMQIITKYYFGFVPFIISMIFPLIVFIAVIFFTSKMAARSETVAILASGVPFPRMLRPFLIGGFILATILWLGSRYVIPRAQEIHSNFKTTYIDRNSSYNPNSGKGNDFYFRADPVTFVGIRYYDTASKSANIFFMEKLKDNKVYYNLRADNIRWDTTRRKWKLENATERKIDGLKENLKLFPELYVNLNVYPKDLRRDEYLKDKMITPELKEYLRLEEIRGSEGLNTYKVELYRRNATPFSVIILTVIGVAVSARKTRGGSGLSLAFGIVMAASFVVMDKFSLTFSTKGNFPPLLAAWMPNIIFTCIAVWLYRIAPK